ncbi:hypothetical protein FJY94_00180 [Candidatus Kaiserbacteria bacterium]|nr:hypothetical protein [Candidatus Kaiserbacteria bacterium]
MQPFGLLLIACAVFLEAAADIFFKKWTLAHGTPLFAVGLLLYTLGTLLWAYSLRFDTLSRSIVIFTVLNLIVVVLAGVYVFGEHLEPIHILGILLGIASIVLLHL